MMRQSLFHSHLSLVQPLHFYTGVSHLNVLYFVINPSTLTSTLNRIFHFTTDFDIFKLLLLLLASVTFTTSARCRQITTLDDNHLLACW